MESMPRNENCKSKTKINIDNHSVGSLSSPPMRNDDAKSANFHCARSVSVRYETALQGEACEDDRKSVLHLFAADTVFCNFGTCPGIEGHHYRTCRRPNR